VKTFVSFFWSTFLAEPIMHEPPEPETRSGAPIDPQRDDLVAQLQEQLRQAEVNLARVKDLEQRKRRRLTLALASAMLLLLLGVGAAGWWYQGQQAAAALRQEQTAAGVNAALREAEVLLARGRELTDSKWGGVQRALSRSLFESARSAVAKAAALKGEDAPKLDKERTHLRQQALDWMREVLTIHTKQLADADGKGREALKQTLQAWQTDTDLASVRDRAALLKLPEAERTAWQQLWTEVEALRQKASPSKTP
jgi:hypothetical protein